MRDLTQLSRGDLERERDWNTKKYIEELEKLETLNKIVGSRYLELCEICAELEKRKAAGNDNV